MTIQELINLLQNHIIALNGARSTSERLGEVNRVAEIDAKIMETESTIAALKGL